MSEVGLGEGGGGEGGAGPVGWALSLSLVAAVLAATSPNTRTTVLACLVALVAWAVMVLDALIGRPRAGPRRSVLAARPARSTATLLLAGACLAAPLTALVTGLVAALVAASLLLQAHLLVRSGTELRVWRTVLSRAPWAVLLVGAGIATTIASPALGWPLVAVGATVIAGVGVCAVAGGGVCAVAGVGGGARAGVGAPGPRPGGLRWAPAGAPGPSEPRRRHRGAITVTVVCLVALFLIGVDRQVDRFNQQPETVLNAHDQGAYLRYAQKLSDLPDEVVANRLQLPLYPYLVSLAPGSRGEWSGRFHAALRINVAIALAGLAAIGWWAARTAGRWAALVSVTLVGLSMFLFLASWVLADVLSALLFTAWLGVGWRLLQRPSALLGAAAGTLAGLTFLSKAIAVAPLGLLLLLCLVAAAAPPALGGAPRRRTAYLAAGAATAFLFVLTVAPYASNSQRVYGSPTFNITTSYDLWLDTGAQAAAIPSWGWVRERTARAEGEDSPVLARPPNDLPSPAKYAREHDVGDVVDRLITGWGAQWDIARTGRIWEGDFGYGTTTVLLLAMAMTSLAVAGERARRRLWRDRLGVALIAVSLSTLALGVAWWFPVGSGNRYLLPVFLPGVLLCVWVIHRGLSPWSLRWRGRPIRADTAVFAALAVPIVAVSVWNALVLSGRTLGGY